MYTNNLDVQEFILHCLIADLNESRVVDLLMWEWYITHIFGPGYFKEGNN